MAFRWGILIPIVGLYILAVPFARADFVETTFRKDADRIVFHWQNKPNYTLTQTRNTVTITFDQTHQIPTKELKNLFKDGRVKVNQVSNKDGKLTVTFNWIKKGYAQTLRLGDDVIVDFLFDDGPPLKKGEVNTITNPSSLTPRDQSNMTSKDKIGTSTTASQPKEKEKEKEKVKVQPTSPEEKSTPQKVQNKQGKNLPSIIPITIEEQSGVFKLIFKFPKGVKAGSFVEGNDLWLYFDKPARFSWDTQKIKDSRLINSIQTYTSDKLSALQLDLSEEPQNTSLYSIGPYWVLESPDLHNKTVPAAKPIIAMDKAKNSPYMAFAKEGLGKPILADMAGSGHPRYFIASSGGAIHVDRPYKLVDFNMLPTIQGVIIDPLSEGLTVYEQGNEVIISKPGGLLVSSESDREKARARYTPASLFECDEWPSPPGPINKVLPQYMSVIIKTPLHQRTPLRFKLIRYYFAAHRPMEALGVLKEAANSDPSLRQSPYFYSLQGLGNFLTSHYEKALKDFTNPTLSHDGEMQFWTNLSKAAINPRDVSLGELIDSIRYTNHYPERLKNEILLLIAEVAADQGQSPKEPLDLINESKLTQEQKNHLEYILALQSLRQNKRSKAIKDLSYRLQMMSNRYQYKYKTKFLLLRLNAEHKHIADKEEIKLLENLSFEWAGGQLEYEIWKMLSNLYLKDRNPLQSLKYLSKAVRFHPQLAAMDGLEDKAENILYLAMTDKDKDLLEKIALYQEFPNFIPANQERFDIRDKMIDVLVKADLMKDAMGLIQEQIDSPLIKPLERAKKKLDYAVLALTLNQPEIAETYAQTDPSLSLPEDLAEEQRIILAQANLMQNKNAEVRDILKDDSSPEAFHLISLSYIQDKDWKKLIAASKMRLAELETQNEKPQPIILVRMAMALTFLNKTEGLLNLRENYWDDVKNSPYKDLFDALTLIDPIDYTSVSSLQEQIAEGKKIRTIADYYRKFLKDHSLEELGSMKKG